MAKGKKLWLGVSGLLILGLMLGACAAPTPAPAPPTPPPTPAPTPTPTPAPAEKYVIKIAHDSPTTHVMNLTAEKFAELCDKYTDGQVQVEIYPAGQLYTQEEASKACIMGAIQMVMAPGGKLGVDPSENLLTAPALWTRDSYYEIVTGPSGREFLQPVEAKGLHGLGVTVNTLSQGFWSNKGPLHLPEDVKGQKIRIPSSAVVEAMVKAVGASPIAIPFAEVVPALERGMVDGVFTGWASGVSAGLHEILDYAATGAICGGTANSVVINKKFWDSLPSDIQDIIDNKVWPEVAAWNFEQVEKMDNDATSKARAAMKDVERMETPDKVEAWRKALTPALQETLDKATPASRDVIIRITGYK